MGLQGVLSAGRTGMDAAKASIQTSGHNIANANTEGFSRQRVQQSAEKPHRINGSQAHVGRGVHIDRIDRINDEYIEKQIRNGNRDLSHMEEKDMALRQTEDIFNEMNGEGMNRIVARFFNEFRKLSNEPDSEAVRQSVRESSQALVNDFRRLRKEVDEVRKHLDSRIEGYTREVNALAEEIKNLNIEIRTAEVGNRSPNDLLDRRDVAMKKLGSYMDLSMHKDGEGNYIVDVRGVGPLVAGPVATKFSVERSPADDQGKPEGAFDLKSGASARGNVTHSVKGGKIGALLDTRDTTLNTIIEKLDEMAYTVSTSVNEIHRQGFTRYGTQGMNFFKAPAGRFRASEFIDLSDDLKASVNNIAAAAQPDSPGDNRVATALSGLQNLRMMNDGKATVDDYFNSIISDVGVVTQRNRSALNQQHDINTQLGKMREQISGVSIDEETTNLMQFQHAFDASAKVIAVADEMLKTVLDIKR